MALELLRTVAPCLTYAPYTGGSSSLFPAYLYNTWLITPPRQYQESLQPAKHFFYEPNGDHLVLLGMEYYLFWPGWRVVRYVWKAEDGSLVSGLSGPQTGAPYWISWTASTETGGFGKIYGCGNSYTYVQEVDWRTLVPVSGGFRTCDWPDHPVFRHAVVNRTASWRGLPRGSWRSGTTKRRQSSGPCGSRTCSPTWATRMTICCGPYIRMASCQRSTTGSGGLRP